MAIVPHLPRPERRRLQHAAKKTDNPGHQLRLLTVLHLGSGHSTNGVAKMLCRAVSTVVRTSHRYVDGGMEALEDQRSGDWRYKVDEDFLAGLRRLVAATPEDFGWNRTTWTRELFVKQMAKDGFVKVSVATMGRALHRIGAKLRMPKPTVRCPWPRKAREARLREIRAVVAGASDEEPVFFSDEVDIHLNPRIGRTWTLPGQRRYVETPGQNKKHYLAGALDARTGELVYVDGDRKASWLFCKLLWSLAGKNRRARRIHLVVDNYIIHKSKPTKRCLADLGGRIVLHFLPPYCPDDNAIERVWLDLHNNVTRNHRCPTLKALLKKCYAYLDGRNLRARDGYRQALAA